MNLSKTVSIGLLLLFVTAGCGGGGSNPVTSPVYGIQDDEENKQEEPVLKVGRVTAVSTDPTTGASYAEGQFIVKAKRTALSGLSIIGENSVLGIYQVEATEEDLVGREIEWYERNLLREIDSTWDDSAWRYVHANVAWEAGTPRGKIAVLDTEIDASNPDLSDVEVIDFVNQHPASDHGTHVTSVVTADNNNYGITGICPQCNTANFAVCGRFGCSSYAVQAGITYAGYNGYKVISMSFGGYGENAAERAAIEYAVERGVTVVAAAGNDGVNASSFFPCSYDDVICVGAVYTDDVPVQWSNYGETVDIWAPGYYIPGSCLYRELCYLSGTSMATPFVSAAIMALNPSSIEEISRENNGIRILDLQPARDIDRLKIRNLTLVPSEFLKGEKVQISYELDNPGGFDLIVAFFIADDAYGTNSYGVNSEIDGDLVWDTGKTLDVPAMAPGYHLFKVFVKAVGSTASDSSTAVFRVLAEEEEEPEEPESGIVVSGTVYRDGSPCDGCRVLITYNESVRYETTTDEGGCFSLKIPNGNLQAALTISIVGNAGSNYMVEYGASEYGG